MPLVRVRILPVGKREPLGVPTRPFASTVTLKAVVNQALEPFEGVQLSASIDVFSDPEEKLRTAQLAIDTLEDVTVGELISARYGTNLVAHVQYAAGAGAGTSGASSTPTSSGSRPASLPKTQRRA